MIPRNIKNIRLNIFLYGIGGFGAMITPQLTFLSHTKSTSGYNRSNSFALPLLLLEYRSGRSQRRFFRFLYFVRLVLKLPSVFRSINFVHKFSEFEIGMVIFFMVRSFAQGEFPLTIRTLYFNRFTRHQFYPLGLSPLPYAPEYSQCVSCPC